ncbi:MAG: HEAT repeat domain-containing protein [Limisphaerales bacterium]
MRKQISFWIIIGLLAVSIVWFLAHRVDVARSPGIFSSEPVYEDHNFTYWMEHWYVNPWGSPVNAEAQTALKAMGEKAVPYLVEWVKEPPKYGLEINRPERALQGFKLLGPTARTAIPELVENIAENQWYPARALQLIGRDAVPPLAEKLMETLADKREPVMNWRDRRYKGNFFHVQVAVIRCLREMGTNAEAAIPALVASLPANHRWRWNDDPYEALVSVGVNHPEIVVPALVNVLTNATAPAFNRGNIAMAMSVFDTHHAEVFLPALLDTINDRRTDDWSRREMAQALAVVGQNHPDLVVPVLMEAFTNSNNQYRDGIAEAMGKFGNQARPALPLLRLATHDSYFYLREKAAIAEMQIAPEEPEALAVLIRDVNNAELGYRQQAIYALGKLGTNGQEAVPALLKCLSHPDTQIRIDATRSLNQIGVTSDEFIAGLGGNLLCTNKFMVQEAVETLGRLASHSRLAFVTLVKKGVCGQIGGDYQHEAAWLLANITRTNSLFLLECLDNSDVQLRSGALEVLLELRGSKLPDAIPKLKGLSTNDPDPNIRSRAADALEWGLE